MIVGFLLWPFLFVVRTLSVSLGLSKHAVKRIFCDWVTGPPIIFPKNAICLIVFWLLIAGILRSVLRFVDLPVLDIFLSLTWYTFIPDIVLAGR